MADDNALQDKGAPLRATKPARSGSESDDRGRRSGIVSFARRWPELAIGSGAVLLYLLAVMVDTPPLAATGYPDRQYWLVHSGATLIAAIGFLVGTWINVRRAPSHLKRFWVQVRRAALAIVVSQTFFGVFAQTGPVSYDREVESIGGLSLGLVSAGTAALLATIVFIGMAVITRLRVLVAGVRTRMTLLDSAAGGIAVFIVVALRWPQPAPGSAERLVLLLILPLAIWACVILVASIALYPLARARGGGEAEFCIAGSVFIALMSIGNLIYQLVRPDVLPRWVPLTLISILCASLGSAADRRSWLAALDPESDATDTGVVRAGIPELIALLLPALVLIEAAPGLRGPRLAIAIVGVAVVAAIVFARLRLTIRENEALYVQAKVERRRAEGFAEAANQQADVAAALLERLTHEGEEERAHVADRLHDWLFQGLSAINLRLMLAQKNVEEGAPEAHALLEREIDEIGEHMRGVRQMISTLRPPTLSQLGLAAAIEELISECREAGIAVEYMRPDGIRLSPEQELGMYRIAQEAIRNIIWHSGAREMEVRLAPDAGRVVLVVRDRGHGFDQKGDHDYLEAGKVGIATMRRRADMSGILLTITSKPGLGTTVTAVVNGTRPAN